MKNTLPFLVLLLAVASGLANGAQVNEYFLCTPKQVTKSPEGKDRKYNCLNSSEKAASDTLCDTIRIDKNNLNATGGFYEYIEKRREKNHDWYLQINISRANGDFQYNSSYDGDSGYYSTTNKKGACTLQKETLKY